MDDPYASPIEPPPPAGPGRIARLGWLWGALAATAVTATGMYLVMQPAPAAAPEPAPTVTVTVTQTVTPSPEPSPTPEPTPTTKPTITLPEVWIGMDAQLLTPEDAWLLVQAPEGFRALAADFLSADYDGCAPEIYVREVNHAGYVIGTEGFLDCGSGANIVWGDQGAGWGELFGMQDLLPCEDFERAGIPAETQSLECVSNDEVYFY